MQPETKILIKIKIRKKCSAIHSVSLKTINWINKKQTITAVDIG